MEQSRNSNDKGWDWRSRKPNNIASFVAGPNTGFFEWWCIYQRPVVNLSDKEVKVMACFLKHRYELSKKILDQDLLDSLTMSDEVKKQVIQECGLSKQYLYVIMTGLKKKAVIRDNGRIEPKMIPNIRVDDKGYFQFLLLFKDPEYKPDNKQDNGV